MFRVPSSLDDLFELLTIIGVAEITEAAISLPVSFRWLPTGEAELDAGACTIEDVAEIVLQHAKSHAERGWLHARGILEGSERAALSPRVGKFVSKDSWPNWQRYRHEAIDGIGDDDRSSHRLVGALGEPAYWFVGKEPMNPDWGASAWEMKTRNRGEEFVNNRLLLLAESVARRSPEQVLNGLSGVSLQDEVGKNKRESRTPTGLRAPGPADNARAWCALWGLSAFPTRPVAPSALTPRPRSRSAGVVVAAGAGTYFGVPVPGKRITLSRYRAVARSRSLAATVANSLADELDSPDDAMASAEHEWLARHGVVGVVVARKQFSDNPNAPEPWAVFENFETTGASLAALM